MLRFLIPACLGSLAVMIVLSGEVTGLPAQEQTEPWYEVSESALETCPEGQR